jgi:hypothetical protein
MSDTLYQPINLLYDMSRKINPIGLKRYKIPK